jgi:hypothetical protein
MVHNLTRHFYKSYPPRQDISTAPHTTQLFTDLSAHKNEDEGQFPIDQV